MNNPFNAYVSIPSYDVKGEPTYYAVLSDNDVKVTITLQRFTPGNYIVGKGMRKVHRKGQLGKRQLRKCELLFEWLEDEITQNLKQAGWNKVVAPGLSNPITYWRY